MRTPDTYFEQLYMETLNTHKSVAGQEDRHARKQRLKETLRRIIGEFSPVTATIEPELLERVDCDDYTRERVRLTAISGLSFAAYVLVPKHKTGRLPAVLAIHGHGYGSREVVGLMPDGSQDFGEPGLHQHFAVQLVKRGLVVIAPDVIGFGERMLSEDQGKDPSCNSSCYSLATQLLLYGKTLTGLRVTELLAALDYLAEREEVDPTRFGTMGFSGGGLLASTCATLDERIQAAVLTGFPSTFKGSIMEVYHCIDNFTPGMLEHAELPEWIGLMAPRALFVESGVDDPLFPAASVQDAIRSLKEIYAQEDASDQLAIDVFPGAHEISGRKAYDWLERVLTSK